jgi:hypothetical protein
MRGYGQTDRPQAIDQYTLLHLVADYFDQVMILDRDELADDALPRPGVPQGKHPHALLAKRLTDIVPFSAA